MKVISLDSGRNFWDHQTLPNQGNPQQSTEAGWRYVGDDHIPIWFQSKCAANFARFLEHLRISGHLRGWRYQPKIFRVKGVRGGYTP